MKNSGIVVSAMLLFAVLVGIGYALTPPPPPPPPVPQNIGLYDTGIDHLQTNATDQSLCRVCHQTSGTNISGGYANTVGGVPTRHHNLLPRGIINPETGIVFACTDCHPSTPGVGMGILLDRSCVNCHNGTDFWGNSIGGHVGNFSRPHHVNTAYASSNVGNPAANRTCNFCHGSFVNNYNDGHYKPTYDTSDSSGFASMITPYATYKITNFSQPDGLGGNKVWGGCESCHDPNPLASPMVIDSNHDTHHKEITGFARFGGTTPFQNASTPFNLVGAPGGRACFICHVVAPSGSPLRINLTNQFSGEFLENAMQLRNYTIESTDVFEPGTTNITFNGTGCEKCHGVPTLHNIQYQYVQNGPQGKGHINNDLDCYGCHNSWLPATDYVPGPLTPYLDTVTPTAIAAGTATTLTLTGSNFVSGGTTYAVVVTIDGVAYTPTSSSDSEIIVDIPGAALSAGTHQLQVVKDGTVLSKLYTLIAAPNLQITSARLSSGTVTIAGAGFGTKPATNAKYYVSVTHAGTQRTSQSISSWSNTQIKAKFSSGTVSKGDVVTVISADSGEVRATVS